jgi:hypothetical protein
MRLDQAFVIRDQMIKQALLGLFDPADEAIRKTINDAILDDERTWKEHLYELFGPEETGRFLANLNKEVS